jgi:acylphosphatase
MADAARVQPSNLPSSCRNGGLPLYWVPRVRNSEAEVICRKYFVGGRVQGVFYRATAARYARELQVTGYAKNLPDGRVEVLACGPEAALEELLKRLWIGSSASKVTSVEVADATPAADLPTDFITR